MVLLLWVGYPFGIPFKTSDDGESHETIIRQIT